MKQGEAGMNITRRTALGASLAAPVIVGTWGGD